MFLRPTGSQWRTPEVGKSFIVTSTRGVLSVQAWPRKRGPAKTTGDKNRQLIFKTYQALIKRLHPRESEYERQAIRDHNRTHRGQRGSAAIRLRDWQTQRLFGRGIVIDMPGLGTFYPPGVHRDASHILDHITATPGEMMNRAGQQWEGIPTGQAGDLLTAGPTGFPCTWQPI